MKYLGHPLIGDFLYHPDDKTMSRQALHCCCLKFRHPITGENLHFEAPLPDDMQKILNEGTFL
jgi:23S rRNA pseudouridine1911/1915/1917 synthase